jgi:hypothetical protein
MYSDSSVAVDKTSEMTGLGFDFSSITDIVKSAVPVGLQIFNNTLQRKQVAQMGAYNVYGGMVPQSPSVYGGAYGILPMNQVMQPQPTFGNPYAVQSGMSTTTMLAIGAAVVVGLLAFKMLK